MKLFVATLSLCLCLAKGQFTLDPNIAAALGVTSSVICGIDLNDLAAASQTMTGSPDASSCGINIAETQRKVGEVYTLVTYILNATDDDFFGLKNRLLDETTVYFNIQADTDLDKHALQAKIQANINGYIQYDDATRTCLSGMADQMQKALTAPDADTDGCWQKMFNRYLNAVVIRHGEETRDFVAYVIDTLMSSILGRTSGSGK